MNWNEAVGSNAICIISLGSSTCKLLLNVWAELGRQMVCQLNTNYEPLGDVLVKTVPGRRHLQDAK